MRPATLAKIETQLAQLNAQIAAIESEGDCLMQAWVCEVKPSGKAQTYPRVQSRLPQFSGKKVRHIRQGEVVADFVYACDRGQRLGKLIKMRDRLLAKLDQ